MSKCIWNVYYVNLDGISSLSLLLASKVGDLMVTSTYKHEDIYKKQVNLLYKKIKKLSSINRFSMDIIQLYLWIDSNKSCENHIIHGDDVENLDKY